MRTPSIWLTALCVVAPVALAEPPTNRQLIAAMTPTTDSVMVWRLDKLREEGSVLKQIAEALPAKEEPGNGAREIGAVVFAEAQRATPLVLVMAGSKFHVPPGEPAGQYQERWICCVKEPLTDLKTKLENKEGIKGISEKSELEGITVYVAKVTRRSSAAVEPGAKPAEEKKEDRFVAFADEHTIVLTDRRDEAVTLIKGLRNPKNEVPTKWNSVAKGIEIESPFLLLRKFDPKDADDYTPVSPKVPEADRGGIDALAVWLPDHKKPLFKMKGISTAYEKDIRFFKQEVFSPREAWTIKPTADGFEADLATALRDPEEPGAIALALFVIFGIWITI